MCRRRLNYLERVSLATSFKSVRCCRDSVNTKNDLYGNPALKLERYSLIMYMGVAVCQLELAYAEKIKHTTDW